jgi:hypothetical protein
MRKKEEGVGRKVRVKNDFANAHPESYSVIEVSDVF